MRKNQVIMMGLICLLIIIGMIIIDVHLVVSNTSTNHQIHKFTLGIKAGESAPQAHNLYFYLEGSGVLSKRLRKEIPINLSNNPAFIGNTNLLKENTQNIEKPLLIVEVKTKNLIWTPVYSRADLSIDFGYSSTGNLTWKYDNQDIVKMQKSPSANIDCEITILDNSFGLMTWRGYQNLLAEIAAHHINTNLAQQLTANSTWEPPKK